MLQSVLNPAGPQATSIGHLWWLMFWVSVAVFVIVTGFLAAAIVLGCRAAVRMRDVPADEIESRTDPWLRSAVSTGAVLTVVILFVLLVASVTTGRAIGSSPSAGGLPDGASFHDAVSIAVYDRQTAILFTGDSVYPGRLYIRDFAAFEQSNERRN